MLHASNTSPSPASLFISRLHAPVTQGSESTASGPSVEAGTDRRKTPYLRGTEGEASDPVPDPSSSWGAYPNTTSYTPPAASRHPFFAHHALPPQPIAGPSGSQTVAEPLLTTPAPQRQLSPVGESSNASSLSSPPSIRPSPQPSPASLFISRLHAAKSAAASADEPGTPATKITSEGGLSGGSDLRRISSLRGGASGPSFGEAASNMSSPQGPNPNTIYTPPAASRHPLFSHHVNPPQRQLSYGSNGGVSPSFLSDPGPSGPPSPSISDMSNLSANAFSPANHFLSYFSSSSSVGASQVAPDAEGARVLGYTLGKLVGRGGFSTVRKAILVKTGEIFACKIVKRDDLSDRSGSLEKFEEEIQTWQNLPKHPCLLPLLDMHRTPSVTFLFIPYMPGGSLLDVLQKEGGSDKTARKWFPGVVAAVSAMHDGYAGFPGGLLHGDLKLDNFLVDLSGKVMVCDFYMAQQVGIGEPRRGREMATIPPPLNGNAGGVGRHSTLPSNFQRGSSRLPSPYRHSNPHSHGPRRVSNEHHLHTPEGAAVASQPFPSASLPYAPPELLRAPPSGPSLAQDIWAVGIILHALLTGRLPFVDAFDPRLQMKILRGSWEVPQGLGKEWEECLVGCLDVDRETRWTIKRIRESDAVVGWREVQSRSKSRSRSRARGIGLGDRYLEPLGRNSSQPVPILSPNPRLRDISRSRDRSGQIDSPLSSSNYTPRDPFALLPQPNMSSVGRSRSVSASRSRSSGHRPMFALDGVELARGLESVELDRGRSARRDYDYASSSGSPYPPQRNTPSALAFARQQGTPSNQIPVPIPPSNNRSRSQSGNRAGHVWHPQSAPAQSGKFREAMATNFSAQGPRPVPTPPNDQWSHPNAKSRSRSRHSQSSQTSTSPSASRSLSRGGQAWTGERDRRGSVWEAAPERYAYGQELGAVHEEDRGRDRGTGMATGQAERGVSRGRKGRREW
ncbi:hypothetical protein I350_07698 [Cryptococcus amylolentus CBS 6273]|uniref:Protein kinase domain-containing protein n=1 Tax=Cryptococcus amylolentus CBS 6273 TaxID=1296118 RepID=A0A1E3JD72_9TREE|nr:hypothetical protein I350_07698 [Cryptococcus amylolentus CBS 6273]